MRIVRVSAPVLAFLSGIALLFVMAKGPPPLQEDQGYMGMMQGVVEPAFVVSHAIYIVPSPTPALVAMSRAVILLEKEEGMGIAPHRVAGAVPSFRLAGRYPGVVNDLRRTVALRRTGHVLRC